MYSTTKVPFRLGHGHQKLSLTLGSGLERQTCDSEDLTPAESEPELQVSNMAAFDFQAGTSKLDPRPSRRR